MLIDPEKWGISLKVAVALAGTVISGWMMIMAGLGFLWQTRTADMAEINKKIEARASTEDMRQLRTEMSALSRELRATREMMIGVQAREEERARIEARGRP